MCFFLLLFFFVFVIVLLFWEFACTACMLHACIHVLFKLPFLIQVYTLILKRIIKYQKIHQQHFRMPPDVLWNLFLPVYLIKSIGDCKHIYKSSLKTILFSYIVYYLLNNAFTKQFPYAIENLYTCTIQL